MGRRVAGRFLLACLLTAGLCGQAWARYQPPQPCRNTFTPEQEISEGKKVEAQVYQQMPVLPENDPVTRHVQELGMRLATHVSGARYNWPYSFHVVASSEINAFALPGGAMFVNLGTVQAAETEAQLAGVMAHELSHVVLRHATCNLAKQQNKSILYGLGSIASQIMLGSGAVGQIAQQGIGLGAGLDFLHMSRDDERQADLLGVGTLYDAGYDPRGLPQFFETIQAKYGAGGAQLLSDHPNPGDRMQYVNAEIATLPRRANPVVTSAAFTRVKAQAAQQKALSAKEIQAGSWKQAGLYISGPGAGVLPVSAPGSSAAQGGGAAVLNDAALGIGGRMTQYQGRRFAIKYPANWQTNADANDAATFAPAGGAGSAGIVYGALINMAKLQGNGVSDAQSLADATKALAQQLSQQNGGLQQVSELAAFTLGGRNATAVELRGRSSLMEGGANLPERDWLVTVARPDGDLHYIVFVSPERDFAKLKPVFQSMLDGFRVQ